jgi:hypothetical protein
VKIQWHGQANSIRKLKSAETAECVTAPAGYKISACFGVGADGIQIDISGEFDLSSARDEMDLRGGLFRGEIIQQNMFGAGFQRFLQFGLRAHFNFDWQVGGLRFLQRGRTPPAAAM